MNFSTSERTALAQLLLAKGPDAPTLCGEWTTRDLAAHLWVREHGLPGGNRVETATEQALARPYGELVEDWAQGPRGVNPWRVLDPVVNGIEHFIHHEDVRRGDLAPGDVIDKRSLPASHENYLHRALKLAAGRAITSDRPVILAPTGQPRVVANDKPGVTRDGAAVVRIDGHVGEIILWLFGRDVVDLEISGDDSAVERTKL
ncbi:MAG: TIGR03085 family protein [Corynebacterium sp.]|mgnify:CR=1 FL=1|nr:TIGR03085 family protein [Corynebacterium sp.]